ncbi:GTPase [Ketogulonicigenium vulgare]|uniref:GTPase n=1 Tax=Ketogulonicigenium vulgare TaxID=92945 RepID=UPI0023583B1E|nr:GTPase [Ketogulonicigenium vulgare]
MKPRRPISGWLMRAERLAAVGAVAIPMAAAVIFGFLYLIEHGWIWYFAMVSAALSLIAFAIRRWPRRKSARVQSPTAETGVAANPEWDARAGKAYEAATQLIDARLATPLPWDQLQPLAIEVIEVIAAHSGDKGKSAFDFTLPEALLLTERVSSRFRADLRRHVPFSDSLSLRSVIWLWQNRDRAQALWHVGQNAWRVFRLLRNPPLAVIQEIDRAAAGGHQNMLTGEAVALLQTVLLQEVAKAAVDLYSGHLRFSDAELLALRHADAARDEGRAAAPDAPLRVVFAGQISAGKSTLINALLGDQRAETDMPPTTPGATAYSGTVAGMRATFLDLAGLDGSQKAREETRAQLMGADMVVWVLKANRPARAPDVAALRDWLEALAQDPARRMPPLVMVAAWVDALLPGDTSAALPPETVAKLSGAMREIGDEITAAVGQPLPLPIPVRGTPPAWNIETLRQTLDAHAIEGLMVQRNRVRLTPQGGAIQQELGRAWQGISTGLGLGTKLGLQRFGFGRARGQDAKDPPEG